MKKRSLPCAVIIALLFSFLASCGNAEISDAGEAENVYTEETPSDVTVPDVGPVAGDPVTGDPDAEGQQAEPVTETEIDLYILPDSVCFDEEYTESVEDGMQSFIINSDNSSDCTIFYFHGGAFITQPMEQHWQFINKLIGMTDAEVIAPIYPLAPAHTYEYTYDRVINCYKKWRSENPGRKAIFLGDSAGGGLALGAAERLRDMSAVMPDKLVLISPWVDLSMSNPDIYSWSSDQTLDVDVLLDAAGQWAGDTPLDDERVSALNADLGGLPETLIVTGTIDCFYPDIIKLHDKLKAEGVPVDIVIGEGMTHVYVILYYDYCPDAMESISEFVGK